MSTLLDQAIIDAAALKEVAIKNAEVAVIEKYSSEIKEAVNALLEQDEDPGAFFDEAGGDLGGEDMGAPMAAVAELTPEEEEILNQIPFNGSEEVSETVPDAPDANDEIELNIDLASLADSLNPEAVEEEEFEDFDMDMPEMDEMDEIDEMPETGEGDMEGIEMDEPAMELSESDLKALLEELEFDYEPKPSGWAAGLNKPTAEMEENIELLAAIEEFKAENEKVKKENDNLKESIELFEKMMTDYKIRTKKYVKIAKQLENKLNEVNLTNARLLYTNRALNSSSLNERQKKSIVESISKAQTIEEAKIIYETLENAVGSSYNKRRPKSLSEAVSRNSSPFYPRRQERNDRDSAFADRMKLLAGIKK